jgi:hypothetical protein
MLCTKCKNKKSTVHLKPKTSFADQGYSSLETLDLCESCAEVFFNSSRSDFAAAFRWLLSGAATPGFVHVNLLIEKADAGCKLTAKITEGSHPKFPPGTQVRIRWESVPETVRHVGGQYSVTCSLDEFEQILA